MIGLDYLGLAHPRFPLKLAIQQAPKGFAIGVFDDPFGDVLPRLRIMLKTGKFPAVRIHAHWANDHKIVPLPKLKKKLPAYEKLARDFPGVKVYVSHSCEYNEGSLAAVRERVALIRQLAPSCIPVNACWKGATMGDVITERHGDVAVPGGIVSHDGINCYDVDSEAWRVKNDGAIIRFYWGARFNLREIYKPGQQVPPPSQRKAAPSKEYIESIVRLTQPKGAPGPVIPGARPVKKPCLWKTHAEDHPIVEDARENRPVAILPVKADKAEIIAANATKIGTLRYGGTFEGGMHRYYSGGAAGLYGHEMGRKALRVAGSEFVYIKVGGKLFGPINPAFRTGYFRE